MEMEIGKDYIYKWIEENWGIDPHIQYNIFFSIIIILSVVLIRKILFSAIFYKFKDAKKRYYWRNGVNYTTLPIGLIMISSVWVDEFSSLATFLGLVSAGIAVALKDPIVNLAGWLFITLRKPFEVGDRVQIGNHSGDVIDIRPFQFTLNEIGNWVDADQSTGRIIHIPNGKVFVDPQANYNQGFTHIWNEIGVLITFESNWEKAKEILTDIVNRDTEQLTKSAQQRLIEASKRFMIFYNNLSPVVYTSVKDSGVMLTIRYLCLPKTRRNTEQSIWEDILREFKKHADIDLAYPTQRIYYNLREGKQATSQSQPEKLD